MNTIPNFILRPTFCSIDALRTLSNCTCVGLDSIPTTNQLQIKENTISLQFKSPYSKELFGIKEACERREHAYINI